MLPDRFDTFRHPAPNTINTLRNEIALHPATDSTLFDIPVLAKINALRKEISAPEKVPEPPHDPQPSLNHHGAKRIRPLSSS